MFAPFLSAIKHDPELAAMHAKQRAFIQCTAPLKTTCAGRRAGKTVAVLYWLVQGWQGRPNQMSVFIAPTADQARWLSFQVMSELNQRYQWGFGNNNDKGWVAPNGFTLRVTGAKDKTEANRLRGLGKVHRVAIDEAGAFPNETLRYLWQDCLRQTLFDTGGTAVIGGTPNPTGVGYYEDLMALCESRGHHFVWDCRDNPYLSAPGEELLAQTLKDDFNGDATNLTYRRENLGERVAEQGLLIYQHGPEIWDPTPPPHRNYTALGVDLGWHDGVGLVAVRSRHPEPGAYVLEAHAESFMLPDRMAAMISRMRQEHRVNEIFVDTAGGGGRTICEMLNAQYGLPAQPVQKPGLRFQIEQIRGLLAAQTLKVNRERASVLADEWRHLPWNDDRDKHREGFADEACNGLMYALTGSGFIQRTTWQVEEHPDATRDREEQAAMARAMRRRQGRR